MQFLLECYNMLCQGKTELRKLETYCCSFATRPPVKSGIREIRGKHAIAKFLKMKNKASRISNLGKLRNICFQTDFYKSFS